MRAFRGRQRSRGTGARIIEVAELYTRYHASLVRLLYRRTGDRDHAEDLAQEVFVRALETLPTNPKPWLFAVALNLARDDGRRAVRQGRALELRKGAAAGGAVPGPDVAAEAVRAALGTLGGKDREALL
ncbi:MAG: hypothetical protein B7Z72_10405, partial [Gemmatimonadetes bacterium 21-71-4]